MQKGHLLVREIRLTSTYSVQLRVWALVLPAQDGLEQSINAFSWKSEPLGK